MSFAKSTLVLLIPMALGLTGLNAFAQTAPKAAALPPGYPAKLGVATLIGPKGTKVYTTYDFTIKAYEAAAWFDVMGGTQTFDLVGNPDEDPNAEAGRLHLNITFAGMPKVDSKGENALIEVFATSSWDGKRMSSLGSKAKVVIDSYTKKDPALPKGYGHLTGHFAGRMCPTEGEPNVAVTSTTDCEDVSGTFDTEVQYRS